MSQIPKTPSRSRARSEAKTPLTPSILAGLNGISLNDTSPIKRRGVKKTKSGVFDVSNPFISIPSAAPSQSQRSRPPSPIKKVVGGGISINDELSKSVGAGLIRKGGPQNRLDVITLDYTLSQPKPSTSAPEIKRSKSTSAINREPLDRFITLREPDPDTNVLPSFQGMSLDTKDASPGHTERLVRATGVPIGRRILGYSEPPPLAKDNSLALQREYAKHTRPGALPSSTGAVTNKARKIPTEPQKVLDAPNLTEDFYMNPLSWSCLNQLSVALGEVVYIWKGDTGEVVELCEAPDPLYILSLDFSNDGMFLGVGLSNGDVELWDVQAGTKLRTMTGHQDRVSALSWNQHLLTSGCGDGSIWHHDVRIQHHKVMELLGHSLVVCGLKWRSDGELLASGGNDNVVNIWDGRQGDVGGDARGVAKWTKRAHTAAVKGLAWCPWQANLLASGGGTNDATINIWNSTTGARVHSVKTPSQISSLQWAPQKKEILSTHGYPTNAIMIHAYPSMDRVAEIRDAHAGRVLFSSVGPGGDLLCTGGGDEHLKFWKIWDVAKEGKKKRSGDDAHDGLSSTNPNALLLR